MCRDPVHALLTIKPNSYWLVCLAATLCRAASLTSLTGHMCHQLSVWAPGSQHPQRVSIITQRWSGLHVDSSSFNGKMLKRRHQRINNERSTQQFHHQIILSCMFQLIFSTKMKLHIHGFKWNSSKAVCDFFLHCRENNLNEISNQICNVHIFRGWDHHVHWLQRIYWGRYTL